MNLTSDQAILWHYGFLKINETMVTTWVMILAMTVGSWLITRRFDFGRHDLEMAGRARNHRDWH